jgi:hypothetical protein
MIKFASPTEAQSQSSDAGAGVDVLSIATLRQRMPLPKIVSPFTQ